MSSGFGNISVQDVRAYWDARPCNVRHSPAEVGTLEYFNQVEARKYLVEPHIPGFAEFDRWRSKKVLEIGCGIGTDTMNFARAGAKVTAVDLSPSSLELARKRADLFGLSDQIQFVEANAEGLSEFVEPQAYDLVYSFGVIHHSPHPEKIVTELKANFVQSGSVLKLMVYNRYSWKVLGMMVGQRFRYESLDSLIAKHSEAQTGCPVTYSYSPTTLIELVGDGFHIDDVRVEHIFPYRIQKYVKYEYEKEWYFRVMPHAVFRQLESRFGWHLCMTATAV